MPQVKRIAIRSTNSEVIKESQDLLQLLGKKPVLNRVKRYNDTTTTSDLKSWANQLKEVSNSFK